MKDIEIICVDDGSTDGTIDIMEGVRRSAAYLRGANFVKAAYKK